MRRLPAPAPFECWLIDLGVDPPLTHQAWLDAAESERAARFVFERDRRRYRAAHVAMRQLIGLRNGVAPQHLRFTYGPFGKPAQAQAAGAFNLSHSEDLALLALCDDSGEIGVDIEMLRPMPDAMGLAQSNFSASEIDELAAMPLAERAAAFLVGWTRKEACLKAIGSGLSIAPNVFTAGLVDDARSLRVPTADGTARVWVQTFRRGPDWVASLARLES